jgi:hypothetical protein
MVQIGSTSFCPYYGGTGLHLVELPGRLRSSWSTRPKPAFPPEIIMGSPRVQSFDESMQEQLRREDVDFIDERRWQAAIRNVRYNQAFMR